MNNKQKIKYFVCLFLFVMLIAEINISSLNVLAKETENFYNAEWEDFKIELGTYNGKKITWRCVGKDKNGYLMLSDTILCYKSYDAASVNYSNSIRKKYGSNYWDNSCIKKWLNSSDVVDWGTGAIPNQDNIKGVNNYENEIGFLSCFTENELALVNEVTQLTYLNNLDYSLASVGKNKFDFDANNKKFDVLFSTLSKAQDKWYQYTTETFFLLGPEQFKMACENVGEDYMSLESSYWLRLPCNTGMSYENIAIAKKEKVIGNSSAYNSEIGIRPAFYLKENYEEDSEPTFHAMILNGISGEAESGTDNDAALMYSRLTENTLSDYLVEENNIHLFSYNSSDRNADIDIMQMDEWIRESFSETNKNDISVFYATAHSSANGEGIALTELYYSWERLAETLARNIKGKIVVILDVCASGRLIGQVSRLDEEDRERFTILASSTNNQFSYSYKTIFSDVYHGRFTYFLGQGIGFFDGKLKADINEDQKITVQELWEYTSDKVISVKDNKKKPMSVNIFTTDASLVLFEYTPSISIQKKLTIKKGETFELTPLVKNTNKKVRWISSNKKVVIVKDGEVTGKSKGKATVTAEVDGMKATCEVTVKNPSIKLNVNSMNIYKGKSKTLQVTKNGVSGTVKWSSSNTSVVSVTSDGTVKAKKVGTAIITAKCGSYSAKCKVTVKKPLSQKESALKEYKEFLCKNTVNLIVFTSSEQSFDLTQVGFAIKDLNYDGIPELILDTMNEYGYNLEKIILTYYNEKVEVVMGCAYGEPYYFNRGSVFLKSYEKKGYVIHSYWQISKGKGVKVAEIVDDSAVGENAIGAKYYIGDVTASKNDFDKYISKLTKSSVSEGKKNLIYYENTKNNIKKYVK